MTQYIHLAVLYLYLINTLTLVADLRIIYHAKIRFSYSENVVILRFFSSTSKAEGNKQNQYMLHFSKSTLISCGSCVIGHYRSTSCQFYEHLVHILIKLSVFFKDCHILHVHVVPVPNTFK